MKFQKGKEKTGGRKKGTPNKNNEPIRHAIQLILEDNLPRLREEFKNLKGTALVDRITQLLEYKIPKLNRTDFGDEEGNSPTIIVKDIRFSKNGDNIKSKV